METLYKYMYLAWKVVWWLAAHFFLFRWWGVHAAGCCATGCWDTWWGGCGHLCQRTNGSPVPRCKGAELCGTCHGLRRLFGALHKLSSSHSPSHSFLLWLCEHTFQPLVFPSLCSLVVQMTLPNLAHVLLCINVAICTKHSQGMHVHCMCTGCQLRIQG